MKVFGIVVLIFALGLPAYFLMGVQRGGFISTQAITDETHYDITGAGMRQVVIRVGDANGVTKDIPLTLFGPIDRIVEPWTAVQASPEGLQVEAIGSPNWKVPEEHFVVLWDPKGAGKSRWRSYALELPPLTPPDLTEGGRLLDVLSTQHPEHEAFFDKLFAEGGLR